MKQLANIFITVVFTTDEYATGVASKVKALSKALSQRYANYEILLVDNGLKDSELVSVKELLKITPCIRVIRLSRVYDIDTAIFAGIDASIGDVVCTLYNNDPIKMLNKFVDKVSDYDIVFGVAKNLHRRNYIEVVGAKFFYWYSRQYQKINVPKNSTYFICMNRNSVNALVRSGRFVRHIRQMAQRVGFRSTNLEYTLPSGKEVYTHLSPESLWSRAIALTSSYSTHPLRALTYLGLLAGFCNVLYAVYVVIANIAIGDHIAKGWTSLSLQSSLMFFILFLILAVLAEYIGKILSETQQEAPYHIMQELSSVINIADETRRNVTK